MSEIVPETPEEQEAIDRFVAGMVNPDFAVLGSYVVIAEVVTNDKVELQVSVSEGIAPWTAMGMLGAAMDVVASASHDHNHDD